MNLAVQNDVSRTGIQTLSLDEIEAVSGGNAAAAGASAGTGAVLGAAGAASYGARIGGTAGAFLAGPYGFALGAAVGAIGGYSIYLFAKAGLSQQTDN